MPVAGGQQPAARLRFLPHALLVRRASPSLLSLLFSPSQQTSVWSHECWVSVSAGAGERAGEQVQHLAQEAGQTRASGQGLASGRPVL